MTTTGRHKWWNVVLSSVAVPHEGEVTPETEGRPAVCTDAGLTTTLDAEGFPTTFEVTTSDG